MKKRLFSIALALCMTLSLLPSAAFAADDGVDGTAVMQSSVQEGTIAAAIQAGDSYTLTNETNQHTITVEKGATLTIEGTGTVDNVSHCKGALVNLGTTTLNGGTFTRSKEAGKYAPYGNGGNSWYTIDNGGQLTINKGVSVDNKGGYSSMIRNGADSSRKGSTLIINGGTFDGGINTVKNDEYGTLTINDGEFSNTAQFVIQNWNDATINNGTFETKDTALAVLFTAYWNEVYEGSSGKLTIHGGTFNKASDEQKLIEDHYDDDDKNQHFTGTAVITGGTFSADPSAYVAEDCGAVNKNGKYEVLKTTYASFIADGWDVDWDNYTWNTYNDYNYAWKVYVDATFADAGYTKFPTYSKTGYVGGNTWKIQGTDTVVTGDTRVSCDVKLVPAALDQQTYNIKADDSVVTLENTTAKMGDTVTFTVKEPEEGYSAFVSVTDANNEAVEFTLDGNKGTFTMPASNVTVAVEYTKDIVIDEDVADLVEEVNVTAGKSEVTKPEIKDDMAESVKTALNNTNEALKNVNVVSDLDKVTNNVIDNKGLDVNAAVKANKDEIEKLLAETEEDKVEINVIPYLELQVKSAAADEKDNSKVASVTIAVTPMVKIEAKANEKTITLVEKQELNVGDQEITMTLPVPNTWSGTAYIAHKGYVYTGKVSETKVTFTNPHGFSDFAVYNAENNPTVATNGKTPYADLAVAINNAQANDTIVLTEKANGANVTTARDNKTITLKKDSASTSEDPIKVTVNGTEYSVTTEGVSLTTPRYSSGGGSSSSTGYSVSVTSPKNGSLSVTPKNASKGDTVTITVSADKGYELGKLTVTDKDGKTVKLTDKGNGKYTFTMPGSKVEVKAEFVETTTDPANPFRDVSKSAYYYNQVLWAVEKGITSGVSANEFAPEAACTRAQMVTFLWKAAGSPEVSGALAFNDVSSDAYYAKAVRWAAQQGITSGTSAGVFSPDAPCTRGQMAMFLYAYAKTPAATGTVPFADVNSNDYFNTAVLWAVNNGITSGTSSTTYSPNSVCTRGQMVVFLYQLLNK